MTFDGGGELRRAFATARDLEPTDAEVERVVAAVAERRRRRRLGRGARAAAAVGAATLAAVGTAAATGLVSIGDVVRDVGFHGDTRRTVEETVVATGAAREIGPWRITTFETDEGVSCMKLTLLDPRARRAPGPATSGYCGDLAAFSELGHGRRGAAARRGETILFGTAPAAARRVELRGSGGAMASTSAHLAPAGDVRYWVLAAPARLDGATVAWTDGSGRRGATLDVGHRFAGPRARTVVASGSAPVAGRWRMTAYESRRLASDGDVYSPEGLPCLELTLVAPPSGMPQRGGSCGVQPRTPGFTRGQARYPNAAGRPLELLMYGRAPKRADAVEVRAGGRTLSTPARPGPPGVPGRFWLIARPPKDFAGGHVYWVDRDGGARGRPVEVLPP